VHDMLHRGPVLCTGDSITVRPCVPFALLPARSDEALGGTADHLRFLSVPDLQGTDGSSDVGRAVDKCERTLRGCTKEGSNALGIRRLAQVIIVFFFPNTAKIFDTVGIIEISVFSTERKELLLPAVAIRMPPLTRWNDTRTTCVTNVRRLTMVVKRVATHN